MNTELKKEFQALSDSERRVYDKMNEEDAREVKKRNESEKEVRKSWKRSAKEIFCDEMMKKRKEGNDDYGDLMKQFAAEWKKMSDAQKQPYFEKEKEEESAGGEVDPVKCE